MNECRAFRQQLESFLERSAVAAQELGWHTHLLTCSACRGLLESEQALDQLLESLPSPHLPPFLAERLLLRLRSDEAIPLPVPPDSELRLDALLELDGDTEAPAGLAARVHAGVLARSAGSAGAGTEERLDLLLERARAVDIPAGLEQRTWSRLQPELRHVARRRWARRSLQFATSAIAAGLLATLGLWLSDPAPRPIDPEDDRTAQGSPLVEDASQLSGDMPDEGLLEALPGLELMELLESGVLGSEDPSILIGTSLDEAELALSELNSRPLPEDLWSGEAR